MDNKIGALVDAQYRGVMEYDLSESALTRPYKASIANAVMGIGNQKVIRTRLAVRNVPGDSETAYRTSLCPSKGTNERRTCDAPEDATLHIHDHSQTRQKDRKINKIHPNGITALVWMPLK